MSENRFIFFHGYDELLWHGYEKNGLIDEFAGGSFLPVPAAARKKKFNELAKKTGSCLSSYPTIIIRGISIGFRAADI